jgi:outer membrane lipopolysaccharide assembly protein LptE/RlpB
MKNPRHRTIVIRECHTKVKRAYRVQKGEKLFKATGEWVLRTLAELEDRCSRQMVKPCTHIEAHKLTTEQIEKMNRSDWYVEMEELIGNVQRGRRTP